jgi:hypothetical protein
MNLVFCIALACQPLTSWQFTFESAPPHYVHGVANGVEYGRCALCTYGVPESRIVADNIFKGGFQ